jgi:N-acetylglucosaminyldiphosphoundecaprenol N-acetyl-beta-D-mannosaminyltransferase
LPLRILGSRVDPVTSQDALHQIQDFLQSQEPHHIVTGNTLMFLAAEADAELRRILDSAALVVPESSGILWASRTIGSPLAEFTPGIDLMLQICRMAQERGHPAFLLGSAPGVAEAAGRALHEKFPALKLAGAYHGYFKPAEESSLIDVIRRVRPSVLFVGMGMPAQEKWIARNLAALGVPVVMGVGGSFDVLSGKLKRAPRWFRAFGAEWLYRLGQEPWRWRRIAQLPIFAGKVLWQKWRGN